MSWRLHSAAVAFGLAAAFAAPARADDAQSLRDEVQALQRRVRELEGSAPTQEEVEAAVSRYLAATPSTVFVGGADGKAGFPLGKKPYIKEGANKLEIAFRNQVRYETFLYSDDAVGVVGNGASPEVFTITDAAPRDRSGFEIERLYLGLDGSIFCEDITFKLELNFDADGTTGVEKRYAYIDWKFSGEHHIRGGGDKVAYACEENHSSSVLAFVDRSIVTKAFELGFDTGVSLWGYFGPCDCPKQFMYKFQVTNGEGAISRGSMFNTDARDTYSDELLFAGMFEWNINACCTGDYKWDEVDHRACDKRCELQAAFGIAGYYENDDDAKRDQWGGLAVRGSSSARAERYGLNAWFRMQWNGLSVLAEGYLRNIQYTAGSTSPEQEDVGAHIMAHYRFADSNWGLGVRAGMIWLDDDYLTISAGNQAGSVDVEDAITEYGFVVNYFFHDHNHKLSADVNFVQDNSGVTSSSAGYMASSSSRGVIVEDGVMIRVQWQLNF
ncbi:MAG: hypothetical protein IT460_00395 [Planctomycetes bacterium]|nr:hypothetical protein [Planctomycetota bacterium]